MKRVKLLLIAGIVGAICLTGCGKSEETTSKIDDLNVQYEAIPEDNSADVEETDIYSDDDESPGEGYVRSSLTNQWVPEETASARPIAVMMPTDPQAQPQYNISNAGVLYECMEEGEVSRQMAIIEGWQDMEKIGNIRSCRRYYIYMGLEWDAIIVHFGGVFYMEDLITRSDVNNISGTNEYGTGGAAPGAGSFFRTNDKKAPHNAYTSGEKLTEAIESLKYETEHRSKYWTEDHFTFTSVSNPNTLEDASGVKTAEKIDLKDIFPVTKSYLEYDEEDGVYYKWLHNEKQVDAATGEQLSFSNVIIQETESEVLDAKDYKAFTMIDSGKSGYYCTQGKVIPITWTKTSDYAPTKYYDMSGNEIVLNTGKTYIAIAQEGTEPVFE